ncbi:hypothetical protein PI126_g9774 [Phytophthora idaei]|nr:hypothetical protein PI126_g9774 [Phytophthora idaei]
MPRSRRARWQNDGPDDSVSSLSVLLDWLTTEVNYNKWRGGDKQSGETKVVLAAQISTLIHEKGITHFRKPKDIITKISQLEQSFRDAVAFLNNTGAGITNESSLQQAIEKRCPHNSILKDVLGDRPSTRPLVTSDDLALLDGAELELDFHEECNNQPAESTLSQEGGAKKRKLSNGAARRSSSIRARSPSVSSTISDWSDLNAALSRSKALEQESQRKMHDKNLVLKRQQFEQTSRLEEWRVACAEEETKCRVLLAQAQAKKEQAQAQREEMLMKVELARNRKRLRYEDIPECEIEELLPLRSS